MRYFVTGATGFIGGKLTRELIRRGHQVVTVARNPLKAGDLTALGVEVHKGDITDKKTMRAPMTGVDGVFHVAAWYQIGARDQSRVYDINVNGTRNVLELMRDLKIPKGVYTSTCGVFGNTHGKVPDETSPVQGEFTTEYERTKSIAHFEVALPMMRDGLPLVVVMPGLVYGEGDQSLVNETFVQYLQRRLPMVPTHTTYAWAHVDDIVEGHLLAMEKGRAGECYIIAGEIKTVVDALTYARDITGLPLPGFRVGAPLISLMASLMGVVERVVALPPMYASETLREMNSTYLGNNAKARRELGYNPRPLAEGLRPTLEALMRQLGMRAPG